MKQGYLVTAIKTQPNRSNGGYMYKIELQDLQSQKFYHTYADPHMKNFKRWSTLVEHRHLGQVIANCAIKNAAKGLVDADSEFAIIYQDDPSTLADLIAEYWSKPQGVYGELFE